MPAELPHEVDRALDYDELIEMLHAVQGQAVFVTTGWGEASGPNTYTVRFVGTLRRDSVDDAGGLTFGDAERLVVGQATPCRAEARLS
jgi:hypothetical protein